MARTTSKTAEQRAAASTESKQASEAEPMQLSPTLRRLLSKPDKKNFRWWFDLGSELLRIHPEPEAGQKRPRGMKTMQKLALQLDGKAPEKARITLVQARKLAMRFSTWKELKKFQGDLGIWHVMTLAAVDERKGNTKSMEKFRDDCVANGWSVNDLKRAIQNDKGNKQASGRRPKLRPPATPAIAVKDLYFAARQWMAYHNGCLAGPRPILTRCASRGIQPTPASRCQERHPRIGAGPGGSDDRKAAAKDVVRETSGGDWRIVTCNWGTSSREQLRAGRAACWRAFQ